MLWANERKSRMKRQWFTGLLGIVLGTLLVGCQSSSCAVIGSVEGSLASEPAHRCLSLCLGSATAVPPNQLTYRGLLLGLMHNALPPEDIQRAFLDERCHLNGLSLQLFEQTQVGTVRGAAISGFFADIAEPQGLQLSLLANRADALSGLQIALAMNRTTGEACGIQLGLLNVATQLHGLQLGLLNINCSGWVLPLLNFAW